MNDMKVIDAIYKEAKRLGSGKKLAKVLDISEQYLSDILNQRRSVSEVVASKMGFKAIWVKESKSVGGKG